MIIDCANNRLLACRGERHKSAPAFPGRATATGTKICSHQLDGTFNSIVSPINHIALLHRLC